MAPSESEIKSLLASESYSPAMVAPLEAYLSAQVAGYAPYVFDAVRTLVKLYALFPDKNNQENMVLAAALALVEYPSTDLLALRYMIPQAVLQADPILKCSELLEACNFTEFWKTVATIQNETISAIVKRAVPRLQCAIASVLALTYKEAPLSVVLEALNVKSAADVQALNCPCIERTDETCVVFVASPDNTKRQRVYQEGVSFSVVNSLLQKIGQ